MLSKFWEGLSTKLADRWDANLLAPAFVFWASGVIAWVGRFGWSDLRQQFNLLNEIEQVAVLVGGLLLITVSSALVQAVTVPILRVLEGYWPHWLRWLRKLFIAWQGFWIDRIERRRLELFNTAIDDLPKPERVEYGLPDTSELRRQKLSAIALKALPPDKRADYVDSIQRLHRYPPANSDRMPTRLGNILRAAESRPLERYGIDTIVCWPRLWLLLPDTVKNELVETRRSLDSAVHIIVWGALFLGWTSLAWWAVPAGLLAIVFGYQLALEAAATYGDLLEATFDIHRSQLYAALRLPLPTTTDEQDQGQMLTVYLFSGPHSEPVPFDVPHKES